jgi:hypothetical protein
MVGLISVWCGLGAMSTLAALTGPDVWWNERAESSHIVIGTPLRGAAETSMIRMLLKDVPPAANDRWLVIFPRQSDDAVLLYVRYQLAHLEYPRRIDVVSGDRVHALAAYTGVITAPGVRMDGSWRPAAERGGFTTHIPAPL